MLLLWIVGSPREDCPDCLHLFMHTDRIDESKLGLGTFPVNGTRYFGAGIWWILFLIGGIIRSAIWGILVQLRKEGRLNFWNETESSNARVYGVALPVVSQQSRALVLLDQSTTGPLDMELEAQVTLNQNHENISPPHQPIPSCDPISHPQPIPQLTFRDTQTQSTGKAIMSDYSSSPISHTPFTFGQPNPIPIAQLSPIQV